MSKTKYDFAINCNVKLCLCGETALFCHGLSHSFLFMALMFSVSLLSLEHKGVSLESKVNKIFPNGK